MLVERPIIIVFKSDFCHAALGLRERVLLCHQGALGVRQRRLARVELLRAPVVQSCHALLAVHLTTGRGQKICLYIFFLNKIYGNL